MGTEGGKSRADGMATRERLLLVGLKLFAEQGFTNTSIRDIAQEADVNVAAVNYYFKDKAGLYRAAFTEPLGTTVDGVTLFDQPHFTLLQSLLAFYGAFLAPLKQGEIARLSTHLRFREMLEPTGLFQDQLDAGIKPAHHALVTCLLRHLTLSSDDDALHRLAFSVVAIAIHLFIGREVIDSIRPSLTDKPESLDTWIQTLAKHAEAMVLAEKEYRVQHTPIMSRKK